MLTKDDGEKTEATFCEKTFPPFFHSFVLTFLDETVERTAENPLSGFATGFTKTELKDSKEGEKVSYLCFTHAFRRLSHYKDAFCERAVIFLL